MNKQKKRRKWYNREKIKQPKSGVKKIRKTTNYYLNYLNLPPNPIAVKWPKERKIVNLGNLKLGNFSNLSSLFFSILQSYTFTKDMKDSFGDEERIKEQSPGVGKIYEWSYEDLKESSCFLNLQFSFLWFVC